jgi:hypothetical protein
VYGKGFDGNKEECGEDSGSQLGAPPNGERSRRKLALQQRAALCVRRDLHSEVPTLEMQHYVEG